MKLTPIPQDSAFPVTPSPEVYQPVLDGSQGEVYSMNQFPLDFLFAALAQKQAAPQVTVIEQKSSSLNPLLIYGALGLILYFSFKRR